MYLRSCMENNKSYYSHFENKGGKARTGTNNIIESRYLDKDREKFIALKLRQRATLNLTIYHVQRRSYHVQKKGWMSTLEYK